MSAKEASLMKNPTALPRRNRELGGAGRTVGLTLAVKMRMALKATLLSPMMLVLLGLGAVSTFLCISYIGGVIGNYSMPYMLSIWYGTYGAQGLTPAFAVMQFMHTYVIALTPLLLFVSAPLGYGVSNALAEDVGAMPENLLLSRPIMRWSYLLLNFVIRSTIIIAAAFVIPFLLAYPGAVSALEGSGGSYIVTQMPLGQWRQLAWGAALMEVLVLYSSIFLVVSAIALALATFSRRGVVAMPAMLVVAGVGPIVSMIAYFLASFGGVVKQGLSLVLHLLLPFRLFTGELDSSYSFANLLIASTAWWVFLLVLSLMLYSRMEQKS